MKAVLKAALKVEELVDLMVELLVEHSGELGVFLSAVMLAECWVERLALKMAAAKDEPTVASLGLILAER